MAGLVRPGQRVGWITDADDIIANEVQRADLQAVWASALDLFIGEPPPGIALATTAEDDGRYLAMDTAAIPDFVAGALAEALREIRATTSFLDLDSDPPTTLSWSHLTAAADLSEKTRTILNWFSDDTKPLKRLALVFTEASKGDGFHRAWLRFGVLPP